MRKLTWKQYLPCVGRRVMKFVKKRRTVGWLLALVVWLAVIERGMNTAELGTRKDCHGILQVDSSVKPQYLMTRLPLAGAGIGERAPVINPGYTKYSYVHQRQSNKKYQGSPPPLWLQKLLYRTLLTVLYIKRTFTHIFQSTRVLLQFTVSYVRALPALLRARMLVSITALSVKTLFSALCRRHIRKAIGCVAVVQRRVQCGTYTARYRIRQVMETRPLPFVTTQVILNVCVVYADQPHCTPGHGMTKGIFRDFTKVREGVTGISTRPRQWLCTKTKLVLILLLCLVLWRCGLVCHLAGYDVGVIEMLLMMSGDVEPNPGPVLGPRDLLAVLTELLEVRADWEDIGLALGLTSGTLDAIKLQNANPRTCLREMLKEWLNSSEPSWEGLIAALRHPVVDKEALARKLEAKYYTQPSPQANAEVIQDRPIMQQDEPPPGANSVEAVQCDPSVPPTKRPKLQSFPSEMQEAREATRSLRTTEVEQVSAPTADVQGQIDEEIRSLKEEFDSIVESVRDLVNQKVLPSEFHQRVSKVNHGNVVINNYLRGLQSNATVYEMFEKLSMYWNYFNYGLLEHVISEFGDDDLKQKMKSYVSELDSFKQKTKLCDFAQNRNMLDGMRKKLKRKRLVVELEYPDWSGCTLSQIEDLTRELMINLDIFLLDVKMKIDCCISLTWFVPTSAVSAMEDRLFDTPCDFFKNAGITLTTLDGLVYYTAELDSLVKELQMIYDVHVPDFLTLQWPPPLTRMVLNLSMIHSQDRIRRKPPKEEHVGLLMRGSVGVYMRQKTSVSLANLFKLDKEKRKVVLIEGAPGAGKSSLAWDICQKWKACEMFANFQIVIYVQLRDPWIQSATSVADLLPLESQELKERVMTQMKTCRGVKTLFVLDGWDEYEPGLKKGSLFHKLICEPHMLQLHYSAVLVTSRPIASRELQLCATSRVEMLGFTEEEIRRYFTETLKDPAQVHHLYEQFKQHPVIEASCYLPLNAAIVAHIFMELNSTLPRTLHGVFTAVVCGCIRRYWKKKTKNDEEIPSLDQIPSQLENEFQGLCALACEGSLVNKIIFSGQELQEYGLSSEDNMLDLMQVVPSFASRRSKLCHFLYVSVQELLSALKISKLAPPEQVKVFQDILVKPRFAAVFRFYAAFTKLKTGQIRDIVALIAQSGQKQHFLNLMHCLYEAQDISLCCFVASHLNGKVLLADETLSPLDCLSVGYFLRCICTSGNFKANLSHCSVNVRYLTRGLLLGPSDDDHGKLWLHLDRNNLTGESVRYLSDVIGRSNLISSLSLSWNQIQRGEDGLKLLLEALRTNASIVYLNLGSMINLTITEDNGPALVEMLTVNKTLQELDLSNNLINDRGLEFLGEGLKKNRGLRSLKLNNLREVTVRGRKRLVLGLKENDHLAGLNLEFTKAVTQSTFALSEQSNRERSSSTTVHQEAADVKKERQEKGVLDLVTSHRSSTSQGFSFSASCLVELQQTSNSKTTWK